MAEQTRTETFNDLIATLRAQIAEAKEHGITSVRINIKLFEGAVTLMEEHAVAKLALEFAEAMIATKDAELTRLRATLARHREALEVAVEELQSYEQSYSPGGDSYSLPMVKAALSDPTGTAAAAEWDRLKDLEKEVRFVFAECDLPNKAFTTLGQALEALDALRRGEKGEAR